MSRRMISKLITLTILALLISTGSARVAKPFGSTDAVFSGSFIQYWRAKDWDEIRWVKEMMMLKNQGVEELILQTIADTKNRYAIYPTQMEGYACSDVDMVGTALKAADSAGIKVRIGLGFNDEWWIKNALDRNWLIREAEDNKKIFNEIIEKYGDHPSIGGWYIPHEFYQLTAITPYHQSNLNRFLKEIATEIKSKSKMDIMISPFYNSKYTWLMSLNGWSGLVENALRDTGIDIVALQDGIGVRHNNMKQLDNLFSHTKRSTDKLGLRFYGNVETFDSTPTGNIPASNERILRQIFIQQPYVEKFIAFSLNHYQAIKE